jgi:glycosyltransferase involved in cell wall biosynthesis
MKKISVIIPTKNRRDMLAKTLDNILAQTLPASEIIVVDNDSSDGTYDLVRRHYRDSVIIVKNPGNQSPGGTRNCGLTIATGDYIQFFDSDDFMTKNKFEEQSALLVKTGSPMVYGPFIPVLVQDDGSFIQKDVIIQYRPFPAGKTLRACMASGYFLMIQCFLFDRNFVNELGLWRDDIMSFEDWDYLWRIACHDIRPVHSNVSAWFYRQHQNQITGQYVTISSRDKDRIRSHVSALENTPGLSLMEKRMLSGQILSTLNFLKNEPEYAQLFSQFHTAPNLLALGYYLAVNRFGKLVSRSNWNMMRGISRSHAAYERYLSLMP